MEVFIKPLYFLCLCSTLVFAKQDTYRAAVLAYNPDLPDLKPLDRFYTNVGKYLEFIDQAAAQHSDIIVLPEDGLTGWTDVITYPDIVEMFSTQLPDPQSKISPCTSPSKKYSKALIDLSCSALKNNIYVVVNLIEQCSNKGNKNYTYFNTNIVFDRRGCIIAKYHKINLISENLFLPGNTLSSFKTDFGVKFGLYTCFDIMFKKPALDVLSDPEVTDIVYPVAWFSYLPFLSALSVHHGYSVANRVNLLAAGYQNPATKNGGSAIYLANGEILKLHINSQTNSKLLIGDVPKISRTKSDGFCQDLNQKFETSEDELVDIADFSTSFTELSNYTVKSIDLSKKQISEKICSGEKHCCTFDISLNATPEANYAYKLIAFHGSLFMSASDKLGSRSCAIVACKNEDNDSCAQRHKEPPMGVTFENIEVKGIFKSDNSHDQPSTLRYDLKPVTNYTFCKNLISNNDVEIKLSTTEKQDMLLTFGLFGRMFDEDTKSEGAWNLAV